MLPRSMNNWLNEEIDKFRPYLRWECLDRSRLWLNFFVFLSCSIIIPVFFDNYTSCDSCDAKLSHAFETVIEFTLSSLATLSFLWITFLLSEFSLQRVLLLDTLADDSQDVRQKCIQDLNASLTCMNYQVFILFVIKCAYKIWWYAHGASVNPFLGNIFILSNMVACFFELASWHYRTSIFFFACTTFNHVHNVQKLRVDELNKFFKENNSDLKRMLKDYLRIFEDMNSINTYFSHFLTLSLVIITLSLVAGIAATSNLHSDSKKSTILIQADFALCSFAIVVGLRIMLDSAKDMAFMMKRITSAASRWHATQTINTADGNVAFQERQALVNCFAENSCGVVIFGVIKVGGAWLWLIYWSALYISYKFIFEYVDPR